MKKEFYSKKLDFHPGNSTMCSICGISHKRKGFYTNPLFWECDCCFPIEFIHHKSELSCPRCNCVEKEGYPDVRQSDLEKLTDEEIESIIHRGGSNETE
jgi:hypothetical protein